MSPPRPSPRRSAERWIWQQAAPERGALGAGLGLAAAAALCAIPQDLLLARAIGEAAFGARAASSVSPSVSLPVLLGALALLLVFRFALQAGGERLSARAAARVVARLRAELAARHLAAGPAALGDVGGLAATWLEGTAALLPYFARVLPQTAVAAALGLGVLATVFVLDPLSGALLLVSAPLIPLFMALIGARAEAMNRERWRSLAALGGALLDLVAGLVTLRLFNRAESEVEALGATAEAYRSATRASLRVAFLSGAVLEFFAALGVALIAVLLGVRLLGGRGDYVAALAILLLVPDFFGALRGLSALYHPRLAALTAAEELAALLPPPAPPAPLPAALPPPPWAITCQALVLAGEERPRLALPDLTFPAGAITALVGPSGAGKTTLLWLLLRYLEPSEGEIRIGPIPLAALDPEGWWRRLAYLPQHPRLFAGRLGETLTRSAPAAGRAALEAALADAGALPLLARLPAGLETEIEPDTAPFSRGEIQRLALARAYLKDAPLLLLDEPTAHLDAATERTVLAGLARRAAGRTVILATHRPAALALADHVVMLAGGRLVAAGRHEALLTTSPPYRALIAAMEAEWASFAV